MKGLALAVGVAALCLVRTPAAQAQTAPEARNMALIGYHDLQGRSAYQPLVHQQNGRWIAYIGHHGGTEAVPKPRNTLNGQEEYNGTSILDVTDPKTDLVVAVPENVLARGRTIEHPDLPFRIETRSYYQNAMLRRRDEAPNMPPSLATAGLGPQVVAIPVAPTYRQNERNSPAAFIEVIGREGPIGTFLVSTNLASEKPDTNGMVLQWQPQTFSYAGRQWKIMLRHARVTE